MDLSATSRFAVARAGLDAARTPQADAAFSATSGDALRTRVGEFVGQTFYGTLIKQMQDSKLKGKYLHGGRGEEVFQGQLGMELAIRAGRAPNDALANRIYDSIVARSRPTAQANQGADQ